MIHLLRDQKGFSIIASIVTLLVLSLLGYVFASLSAMTQQSSAGLIQAQQAFYAAEAGIEFALRQIRDGTPPPLPDGITLTLGSSGFTVISCTTEETCPSLPAGQRRVFSTGQAGEAKQRIEVITTADNIVVDGGFADDPDTAWPLTPLDNPCNDELGGIGATKLEGEFLVDQADFPPGGGPSSISAQSDLGGKFRRCREQSLPVPLSANTPLSLRFDLKMTWEGSDPINQERFWVSLQGGGVTVRQQRWEDGVGEFTNSPVPPSTPNGEGWVSVGPINFTPESTVDKVKIGFRVQQGEGSTTRGVIKLDNLAITKPGATLLKNSWQEPVH